MSSLELPEGRQPRGPALLQAVQQAEWPQALSTRTWAARAMPHLDRKRAAEPDMVCSSTCGRLQDVLELARASVGVGLRV